MASLSSCVHNKSYQYDVFLSFSGEDTRKTFVDHLYAALDQHGICTFKDDERLEKGKKIKDDLLQSIEESRLYIIVFSKSYASSSWCLNELLKIMQCHKTNEHMAFPVFYDVDPYEVRKQSGLVGEAIATHKDKNDLEVGKWREALTEAANLSGWDVRKTADGHEAKVIKLIIEKVLLELRPTNINVDENLVGMEQRMQDLDSCLEIGSNDVRMIGIKGMGGAGKTTLARAIFDKISFNFEGKSFVENVRERVSQSGLKKLQTKILRDVFKDDNITISDVHEGKRLMKKKLCCKKVLVVLDDVDHKEHLEILAGDSNWFKAGSRIIITTRDVEVLGTANRVTWIHDVSLFSKEEAMCLFKRHAFGKDVPTQEFERHSREVVSYANGLPLTIKVLGSNLCGKDDSEWIDVLERLKTIPLKETLKILQLSYENLEDDQKEIFLDVACFLREWNKDDAIRVLESCGFYAKAGLRVLEQKSLLTLKDYKIQMHDHLVEMGKSIVRHKHPDEPNRHSRLWVSEEIKHVLASDSGNEATRCIDLKITSGIVWEGLRNMKKLRFLNVSADMSDDCVRINDACLYFPNSLQYLSWYKYPHWCLPKTFEANNLVTLKMSCSKIEQLWEGGKVMKNLKFLELSYSKLRSLDLGLTPNLESLQLEKCDHFVKLYVHAGKFAKKLKFLNLSYSKLRSLNLGLMPNLEWLDIHGCLDLAKLYVHNGYIKRLVYINLIGCSSLKSNSLFFIEQLESLEVLHIDRLNIMESLDYLVTWHCNKSLLELHLSVNYTQGIHASIGNYHKLVSLVVSGCDRIKSLSDNICSLEEILSSYEDLRMHVSEFFDCHYKLLPLMRRSDASQHFLTFEVPFSIMDELPKDLGQWQCLENIKLVSIYVKHLPPSIVRLKHLKTLVLSNCVVLEKLPEDVDRLESLVQLKLLCCHSLRDIPNNICKLKRLKELTLNGCTGLEKLPDNLGDLECLQKLSIRGTCITHLPPNISSLKGLEIQKSELKDKTLDDTTFQLCFNYDYGKPQIQSFQHLRLLDLGSCDIEEVPETLGEFECLEEFNVSHTNVKHLPDSICMLKHLKKLFLNNCGIKEVPEALGQLESLEELKLSYTDVKYLPDSICMLKHLKELTLQHCVLLEKLPGDVGQLESLEVLDLARCYGIREIPNSICLLKQLKILNLDHCFRLEKLPEDVGELESMEELYLSRCYTIREIPNSICMLKHLKKLELEGCRRLEKLPDELGDLECLQELTIWDTGICHFPQSISLLNGLDIYTQKQDKPSWSQDLHNDQLLFDDSDMSDGSSWL